MAKLLRADVAHEVRRAVCVPVHVAIETDHALARFQRAAVVRGIELLLGERRQQEPQPLQLLRVEDAVEEPKVVAQTDDLAVRHVAQIEAGGQENGRRKLRQEMVRQIEIQIEPRQIAVFLLLDLVDVKLRKQHPAFGMIGVRQGQKALRPKALIADFLGRHGGQIVPRADAGRQPHPHALLHGLAPRHGHGFGGPVAQIVPLLQERRLPLFDRRLLRLHAGDHLVELFRNDDGRIAARPFFLGPGADQHAARHDRHGNPAIEESRVSHGTILSVESGPIFRPSKWQS